MLRYEARPGSRVRVEGISTRSDWQVESTLMGGFLEVGPAFPEDAGNRAKTKILARAEAFVPVRSLKSVDKGGRPFSDEMDKIMYEKLSVQDSSGRIVYRLLELIPVEGAQSQDGAHHFDSRGELVLGGATNSFKAPIQVRRLDSKSLKISGSAVLRMTDLRIQPPNLTLSFGPLKTGNEVKLIFEWVLARKTDPRTP